MGLAALLTCLATTCCDALQVNALAPMRLIRSLAPKMCDKGEVRSSTLHRGVVPARQGTCFLLTPPAVSVWLQGWIINITGDTLRVHWLRGLP